ncbi:MAG: hypothetical protein ACRDK7_06780 [Solirubrobacteraceae bacterium]
MLLLLEVGLTLSVALFWLTAGAAAAIPPRALSSLSGRDVNSSKVAEHLTNPFITQAEEDYCELGIATCVPGVEGSDDGELAVPGQVAINEDSGNVYLADSGNHRLDEFSGDGRFLAAWGYGVSNGSDEYQVCNAACESGMSGSSPGEMSTPYGVAVNNVPGPLHGDVYVADSANKVVEVYTAAGNYLTSFAQAGAPSALEDPVSLAVNPTSGALYVADAALKVVDEFATSETGGMPMFTYTGQLKGAKTRGAGALTRPDGIAVAANGTSYVENARSAILRFGSSGTYETELISSHARAVTLEATSGLVYAVIEPSEPESEPFEVQVIEEDTLLTSYKIKLPPGEEVSIAVNSKTGTIYTVDSSDNTMYVLNATPLPAVRTEQGSNITETSAQLNGAIEPGGIEATYYFQYGSTEMLGNSIPASPEPAGTTTRAVSQVLSNLAPHTPYYYRLVGESVEPGAVPRYGAIEHFTTATHPPTVTASVETVTQDSAVITATIAPEGVETSYMIVYSPCSLTRWNIGTCTKDTTATVQLAAASGPTPVNVVLEKLAPDMEYVYEVTATNGSRAATMPATFVTAPLFPEAITLGAGEVGSTSGVVYAGVNPQGSDTTYLFEYGTTDSYGVETSEGDAGSAAAYGDVSAALTGLSPDATYHYRVVATNNTGRTPQTTYGEDKTFATTAAEPYAISPLSLTTGAEAAAQTLATLTGTVDPHGSATTYDFEYGTTAYYGQAAPLAGAAAGSLTQTVSEVVTGLQPGTTYHYRVVAYNEGGTSYGEDETFTTLAAPAVSGVLANSGVLASKASSTTPTTTPAKPKALTNAQKLAKALKSCRAKKAKHRREAKHRRACEAAARKKYAPKAKPKRTKKGSK